MEKLTNKLHRWFWPSVFTILNLFFGCMSVFASIERNFHSAAWFIIFAILCDGLDGNIARWQGYESTFGVELDSLADLISSGLAPAVLAYRIALAERGTAGMIICFLYVFAGTYRLARFNVIHTEKHTGEYTGLPIPVAGMTLASFHFFRLQVGLAGETWNWAAIVIGLTILMVSTVPYQWPRFIIGKDTRRNILSLGIVIILLLMALTPYKVLFLVFLFYILQGILRTLLLSTKI